MKNKETDNTQTRSSSQNVIDLIRDNQVDTNYNAVFHLILSVTLYLTDVGGLLRTSVNSRFGFKVSNSPNVFLPLWTGLHKRR